jgi:hypothetical protein
MKETEKEAQVNEKILYIHVLEEPTLLNTHTTQSSAQIQQNSFQYGKKICHRKRKGNPRIHVEPQKTLNS